MNTIQESRIVPTATLERLGALCSNASQADALGLERRVNAANLFYTHGCLTVWTQPENHEMTDALGARSSGINRPS